MKSAFCNFVEAVQCVFYLSTLYLLSVISTRRYCDRSCLLVHLFVCMSVNLCIREFVNISIALEWASGGMINITEVWQAVAQHVRKHISARGVHTAQRLVWGEYVISVVCICPNSTSSNLLKTWSKTWFCAGFEHNGSNGFGQLQVTG